MIHKKKIACLVFLFLGLGGIHAQEAATGTGVEATGISGAASYSVGQVFYAAIAGVQGPAGLDGTNGADGTNGIDGSNGVDGIDGLDGAVGAEGTAGSDGANGVDGSDGIDGVDGADAPVYSAGTGIDITSGVISATASGSAPEFLFVQPDAIVSGYVGFGSASAVNGIAYNSVTDKFTLKAGKTYMLDGAVHMHTTTSSNTYSFVFYDKTNNSSIGSEAYQRTADYSGTVINQPSMTTIIIPVTDIQVGIKDIYDSTGGFISSRGFFKVVELN